MPAKSHGLSSSRTYQIWCGIKTRICNNKHANYRLYGGRGIKLCDRWYRFEEFLQDMGEAPEGASIDRIDCNGDYAPGNCRWATVEQQRNNCRTNRFVECWGQRKTVAEWAKATGLNAMPLIMRLNSNWPPEEALSLPPGAKRKREFCRNGHKIGPDSVYVSKDGRQRCKECHKKIRLVIEARHSTNVTGGNA